MQPGSTTKEVVKERDGTLTLHLENGEVHRGFEAIIAATGRHPLTASLGLDAAGVNKDRKGYIPVDDYQNTNVPGVYALGDVCGKVSCTDV